MLQLSRTCAHFIVWLLTHRLVTTGKLESLKNGKKDVNEIRKGSECGLAFEEWQDVEVGDQIQAYEEISEKRHL